MYGPRHYYYIVRLHHERRRRRSRVHDVSREKVFNRRRRLFVYGVSRLWKQRELKLPENRLDALRREIQCDANTEFYRKHSNSKLHPKLRACRVIVEDGRVDRRRRRRRLAASRRRADAEA